MSSKHDLKHSILSILRHNKDGSFATQSNRRTQLLKLATDLLEKGFYLRNIHQLKSKHIYRMVAAWRSGGLSTGTIKNRMCNIRWLCEKINKPGLVSASNDTLKIEKRQYVTNRDKSIELDEKRLEKMTDPNVKMSLRLQKAFGLRKEESIKIKIHEAYKDNFLALQGSWCKNGRPRQLAVRTSEQREVIAACKMLVGNINRALIVNDKTYYQQMKRYENELAKAGLNKVHGLRHAYAQKRYQDLTGWAAPVKGGPRKKQLNDDQLALDKQARQIISEELGHERASILAIYCGQ